MHLLMKPIGLSRCYLGFDSTFSILWGKAGHWPPSTAEADLNVSASS